MPRIETTTRTLYKFNELSDTAKEQAREWMRELESQDFDPECVLEYAETVAKFLGITLRQKPIKLMNGGTRYVPAIYYSGFYSQGSGACFEGSWNACNIDLDRIKTEFNFPAASSLNDIANTFADIAKMYPNASFTVTHTGRHANSHSVDFEIVLDSINNCAKYTIWEDTSYTKKLEMAARDFMDWIYEQLKADYEYLLSDASIDETIEANEYEFTENGVKA